MRGTLHFVSPADVHWMLPLLTPRVIARSTRRYRELELDDATFARSRRLFEKALRGGKQLTRPAMYSVLDAGGISSRDQRGPHLLGRAAQDGLICFGPREGKQPTFVLLDEWLPASPVLERNEALARLATRYFTSHGPATLVEETIVGQVYWRGEQAARLHSPGTYLLPPHDELTVAYRDRSAILDPEHAAQLGNGIFSPIVVVNGRVIGTWTRETRAQHLALTVKPVTELNETARRAVGKAARRFGQFIGKPVQVTYEQR